MRSTTLFIAALSITLFGCKEDQSPDPMMTGGGSTTEEATTTTTVGAEESTTAPAESTGEGDTSTGEAEGSTTMGPELGCPYEDPGWQEYGVGVFIPHWELIDHKGEPFNVCDHFNKPLVVDTSAVWCPPCQALASYMAGNDAAAPNIITDPEWVENYLRVLRDHVNDGCVTWVTVLTQNEAGGPPTQEDAASWDLQYPNERIQVIADPTGDFESYLNITAYPTTFLVNNTFKYLTDDLIGGIELIVDNLECVPEEPE